MAAPVVSFRYSYSFRDAKGQVALMRVLIGGATEQAVDDNADTLKTHLAAGTNANVRIANLDNPTVVYGAVAQFQNVEDKLFMLFSATPVGTKHRFRLPAPLATMFLADLETPDISNAALAAIITDFQSFVYGHGTDTSPLTFVGGLRARSKFIRRFNLLTKSPLLTGPGE